MGKALTRPSGTSNATFELIRFPLSKNEAAMIFGSVDQKRPSAEMKSLFFLGQMEIFIGVIRNSGHFPIFSLTRKGLFSIDAEQ